ncbi:MAG: ATP-binding protein [Chromatiales bacterium]
MNAPQLHGDWTEANQRYLVAEFGRLKGRLCGEDQAAVITVLERARSTMPAPAAIDHLAERFGLSRFERELLLLCAGVEMDAEIARRCAEAQGHPQRSHATFGLALAALEDPHWSALTPVRPLRRWRMIEIDDRDGVTSGRLRIDERVLHYLAGVNYLDTRLQTLVRAQSPPRAMAESHRQIGNAALKVFVENGTSNPVICLTGDDPQGQIDVAAQVATEAGLQICIMRAEDLQQSPTELDAFAVLWQREAVFSDLALLVECGELEASKPAVRLTERLDSLLFIASREPLSLNRAALHLSVNRPDAQEQKQLWERALGPVASRLNGSLDGVATQFRLSAQTILSTGEKLRSAVANDDQPDAILWSTCRRLGGTKLDELAKRIVPAAAWEDLILPDPQKSVLRQIAAHARQRLKVYQEWGFATKGPRGLGISALFSGESGTGKTMAAEALANELQLDLYRIDLSSVVSKYIGETEKNLKRVFDVAEDSGAILLFDEADALFGKRSEVKDSHDRYANIEVSYLLQRMEAYRGLAILTTNQKAALDTAFQRRLRFVVHFPFPDLAQRELIWRGVFPASTPVNGIDYAKLARLNVAGGSVRNIALNAAFLAAENKEPVGMAHLLQAAHSEASKRERPLSDAETQGWV